MLFFKKIIFKSGCNPEVSVIIPVYNNFRYTYNCLLSIYKNEKIADYEIILADDCSSDKTKNADKIFKNIKIIRNSQNFGFLENCNNAVDYAESKYLLFLNNDTEILENGISHLLQTIKKDEKIGVVGGKIIFFNGILQEAGSIIFEDGTTAGYGRGDDPKKPEYNFLREVDYCSGAFLLCPRDLFLKFGKFDTQYKPGYYEEADFCMRLRKEGYKVVYQPRAKILHRETATIKKENAIRFSAANCEKFYKKWEKELHNRKNKKKVLYIDDRIPDPCLGSGYPRAYAIINSLIDLNCCVTFYPLAVSQNNAVVCEYFQQKGVEMMYDTVERKINFDNFFRERKNYYDIIFVSRPHNMKNSIDIIKKYNSKIPVVYDAEAIFAKREALFFEIAGKNMTDEDIQKMIKSEMELCSRADKVITVSENEKKVFEEYGVQNLHVVSHSANIEKTSKKFESRQGILFVGPVLFGGDKNPNLDAINYFIREIFPVVNKKIKCEFNIAGIDMSGELKKFKTEGVNILGRVENLYDYYNISKVFVAPTRFSAGIPLKVIEAASHGVPVVVTKIIADQLGWMPGEECLVGYNPWDFAEKIAELYSNYDLWEKIRSNSLERVRKEYNPQVFRQNIWRILYS